MEGLANKIAQFIGNSLNKTKEQTDVIAYGLTGSLQIISIFLLALIIGIVGKVVPEVLIIYFSVGFLRRLIGGVHSKSIYSCLGVSVISISLFSFLTKYVLADKVPIGWLMGACGAIYLFSFVTVYLLAPVEAPNKPIRSEQKRSRLRRNAFLVLTAFCVITCLLFTFQIVYQGIFLRLAISLAISVLWQTFMLTKAGHYLISSIDRLFGIA